MKKKRVKDTVGALARIIAFMILSSAAGDVIADDNQPLKLEHADRLLSTGSGGETVNLVGDVHLSHEGVHLYSQKATWYRTSGLVQFSDSVTVVDSLKTIRAGAMTYYRKYRRLSARNGVEMIDKEQDMRLVCESAEYYRDDRRFMATGKPVLILHPENDSSKMEIYSEKLDYFADEKRGVAHDSVKIIQKDMIATSERADFAQDPEGAVLTGNPEVLYEENRLVGDTISIFTKDRAIERLLARGDAGAYYKTQPDSTVFDFTTADLTGRELEAFFVNDKIEKAVMRDNAVSVYTPAISDTLTRGVNIASGDSITVFFDGGYIRRVFISGGARGEYIEPKFEPEDEHPKYDTTRYSGRDIDYSFENSRISLFDHSEIKYQDMILNAGDIRYGINTKILTARGIKSDTSDTEEQTPELLQGIEKLDGERMSYNLETKRGQVTLARTKFEDGFYNGEKIRQVSENVLFVSSGNYTSCNLEEEPHYHFHSNRMKMVGKDKVIAKPVILYIGDLPVFAIPYYVFPVRKGRHSGFLTFEIGNFERGDRFIRNLGYYWAASDYWDLETSLDFYENKRTIFNNRIAYNLRYRLNGDIGLNYSRGSSWSNYKKSVNNMWRLTFNHSQKISPTADIYASGSILSSKSYTEENVYDQKQRLDQRTVTAKARFNKKWEIASMNISADQTWNLDTDEKRENLPSLSLTIPAFQIFRDPTKVKKKERIKPWEEIEEPKARFYHSIYFSLNSDVRNFRNRIRLADSTFIWKNYQTLNNTSTLSMSQSPIKYLTISPSINAGYTVYHVDWNRQVDSLGLRTDRVFTRYTYNVGVNANTNIYGTVYPNVLGITGLRHVITPTVGYRFTPKLEKNEEYRAYTGVGAASSRSKSMTFSLRNLFQMKYLSNETEKRLDLFTLDFNGGYDFAKTENKINDVRASLRTAAIPHISVYYNSSYSFYNFDNSRRPLTNPRLVNATVTTTLKGSSRAAGGAIEGKTRELGRGLPGESPIAKGGQSQESAGFGFNLSHRYTVAKNVNGTTRTQWVDLSLELQPTSKWNISYSTNYDLKNKRISSQQVNIGRDMHCWEARFTWIPSGTLSGYYIRINIKSLPDIKLEKSEGGVRG